MKVKELIRKLERENPNSEVIIQLNSGTNDGNSPLYCIEGDCVYVPESDYCGEIYDMEWTAVDACLSQDEWNEMKRQPRCVLLMAMK